MLCLDCYHWKNKTDKLTIQVKHNQPKKKRYYLFKTTFSFLLSTFLFCFSCSRKHQHHGLGSDRTTARATPFIGGREISVWKSSFYLSARFFSLPDLSSFFFYIPCFYTSYGIVDLALTRERYPVKSCLNQVDWGKALCCQQKGDILNRCFRPLSFVSVVSRCLFFFSFCHDDSLVYEWNWVWY